MFIYFKRERAQAGENEDRKALESVILWAPDVEAVEERADGVVLLATANNEYQIPYHARGGAVWALMLAREPWRHEQAACGSCAWFDAESGKCRGNGFVRVVVGGVEAGEWPTVGSDDPPCRHFTPCTDIVNVMLDAIEE